MTGCIWGAHDGPEMLSTGSTLLSCSAAPRMLAVVSAGVATVLDAEVAPETLKQMYEYVISSQIIFQQ